MPDHPETVMLIVAAGRGLRAGGGVPKQYRHLAGQPVLSHTLEAVLAAPGLAAVQVVIHPDDQGLYAAAAPADPRLLPPVRGGNTRQASVRAGLEALAARRPAIVLVHDGARPFVTPALIARAIGAIAAGAVAAIPGLDVTDTLKQVDAAGRVVATPDRESLRAVQTPQAFAFQALMAAHASAGDSRATDDAAVMERAGYVVTIFPGEAGNGKLTTEDDFTAAESRLAQARMMDDIRIGQGYDVHAFGPGDHVWLGGLRLAHDRGVVAHSDGDVVLHAATDAILGALADGDIGSHFPPSDPQWKGASSDRFLAHAAGLLAKRGGRVAHLDISIVCEAPKIGPHRDAMRARIAAILHIDADRVAIKATTSEKLGFVGRREGLAALALATVRLPG